MNAGQQWLIDYIIQINQAKYQVVDTSFTFDQVRCKISKNKQKQIINYSIFNNIMI